MIFFLIAFAILFLCFLFIKFFTSIKRIIKLFENGNVCVTGLRGTGKDMLTANVIARRGDAYVSNMDYIAYKKRLFAPKKVMPFIKLDFDKLDVKNNYKALISGNIVPYDYPYPEKVDIYISDCGVYFPSQYCSQLNKEYEEMPVFQALSRHLGDCNFHVNAQNLNRVWDKIREQSDIYIRCKSCKVLFGRVVVQKVVVYDKYDACVNRVEPFKPSPVPFLGHNKDLIRSSNQQRKLDFNERNGSVKAYTLIYRNRSKYDTRLFKKILGGSRK